MQEIIDGFLKFQRDIMPARRELFRKLATSQTPRTLFISCSDSRMVPELVTQREPGDLFVIRNAGNIVPSFGPEPGGVSATVEYAVAALGVTDVVICGHSDCGAMTAVATCKCLDHMPAVANWLRYADSARLVNEAREHAGERERVDSMVRENVIAQLDNLKTHPPLHWDSRKAASICTDGSTTSNPARSTRSTPRLASSCRSPRIPMSPRRPSSAWLRSDSRLVTPTADLTRLIY